MLLTKVVEKDESRLMSNIFFSLSLAVSEINNIRE
jgi:hypothetical protein